MCVCVCAVWCVGVGGDVLVHTCIHAFVRECICVMQVMLCGFLWFELLLIIVIVIVLLCCLSMCV